VVTTGEYKKRTCTRKCFIDRYNKTPTLVDRGQNLKNKTVFPILSNGDRLLPFRSTTAVEVIRTRSRTLSVTMIVLYQATLTADHPLNTAVVAGADITFSCYLHAGTNTTSFRWYYYPPSSNQPQVVHTGRRLRSQFAARHHVITDHSSGRSQLTIAGVTLQDAGCYSCYELSASRAATRLAAELIVLGKIHIIIVVMSSQSLSTTFSEFI